MRIRLLGKDERRVAFSGVARTGVSAVNPGHEITIAVPDGEDEDRTTLESATLGGQTSDAETFNAFCVAVFLGKC